MLNTRMVNCYIVQQFPIFKYELNRSIHYKSEFSWNYAHSNNVKALAEIIKDITEYH